MLTKVSKKVKKKERYIYTVCVFFIIPNKIKNVFVSLQMDSVTDKA